MSPDLLEKPDQDADPIQNDVNDRFNEMVKPENYAQDGVRPELRQAEEGAGTGSLFNPNGDGASKASGAARTAGAAAVGAAGLEAAEGAAGLYNPAAAVRRGLGGTLFGSTRRKQASIGGSIVGLIVGGGFFAATIVSGPLKIVHFGQLMTRIHLTTGDNQSNDRTGKVMRTIRNYKNRAVYRNNLGILGNTYADRIEAKLNASGYKSSFNPNTGAFEGLVIDRNSPEYKGKNDDQIRQQVKEKLNVELKVGNLHATGDVAQLHIDPRDMGYVKGVVNTKGVIKNILKTSGYAGKIGPMETRVIGKRYGLTFHPIKRLDARLIKAADDALRAKKSAKEVKAAKEAQLKADMEARLSQGAEVDLAAEVKPTDPKQPVDPASDTETRTAAAAAKEAADGGSGAAKDINAAKPGALSDFVGSKTFKVTAGGAAIVGLACLAKGLDDSASSIKEAQVIEPLMRMSAEMLGFMSQIMSGQDIDIDQVAYYASTLNDPNTGSDFINAASVQSELGNKSNAPVSKTLTTIGANATPFHFLNEGSLGEGMNAVCSTVGQTILFAVGFLGGPVGAAVGTALGIYFGPAIINTAAHWFAGKAISTDLVGAAKGDAINFGTVLLGNADRVAKGASKLSPVAANELKQQENIAYQEDLNSQSIFQKVLSPTNQNSVVASLLDRAPSLQTATAMGSVHAIFSLNTYTNMFGSLLSYKASADPLSESYNYGLPTYGFTTSEMDNPDTSDPFANADAAAQLLDDPINGSARINKASECFSVKLIPNFDTKTQVNVWDVQSDPTMKPNYYASAYDSLGCNDSSANFLKIRFFIFDTLTTKALACNEGDSQSCLDLGFGQQAATNSSAVPSTP